MPISKQVAFAELTRREAERAKKDKDLKQNATGEDYAIKEISLLEDLKGLISEAIPKLQSQNELLLKTAIASLDKEDANIPVIKALQSQTKEIIKTLEQLEQKASKAKWTLKTENIERGRDGKVISMEVIAIQT